MLRYRINIPSTLMMKITTITIALLLFFHANSSFALQPAIEADRQFLAAQRASKEANYLDAVIAFDAVVATGVKKLPPDFEYFFGHALLKSGDYQRADKLLSTYLDKSGKKAKYYQQALLDLNEVDAGKKQLAEDMETQRAKEEQIKRINNAWRKQLTTWEHAPAESNVCSSLTDRIRGQSKSARNISCSCTIFNDSHPAWGHWEVDRCKVTWQGNPILDGVSNYDVSKEYNNRGKDGKILYWDYSTTEDKN